MWEDPDSVSVVPTGQKFAGKKATLQATTILKRDLSSIDRTRMFVLSPRSKKAATPSISAGAIENYALLALGAACLVLVIVMAYGVYLNDRDASADLVPITDSDLDSLQLPQPYMDRARCALALGKDLRICREENSRCVVLYVRNTALPRGYRSSWKPAHSTPMAALREAFDVRLNRRNPRADSIPNLGFRRPAFRTSRRAASRPPFHGKPATPGRKQPASGEPERL